MWAQRRGRRITVLEDRNPQSPFGPAADDQTQSSRSKDGGIGRRLTNAKDPPLLSLKGWGYRSINGRMEDQADVPGKEECASVRFEKHSPNLQCRLPDTQTRQIW